MQRRQQHLLILGYLFWYNSREMMCRIFHSSEEQQEQQQLKKKHSWVESLNRSKLLFFVHSDLKNPARSLPVRSGSGSGGAAVGVRDPRALVIESQHPEILAVLRKLKRGCAGVMEGEREQRVGVPQPPRRTERAEHI